MPMRAASASACSCSARLAGHVQYGSQRMSGRFYTIDDRTLVYLGALHFASEAPLPYGRDAQRDQVALAVRPGRDRVRLEFPSPSFDSMFDILEMRRVGAAAPPRK